MGFFDSLGVSGLGGSGSFFQGTGSTVGTILLIFLGVVVFGVISFFVYFKFKNKKEFYITVNLFKIVNGKRFFIKSDKAREIIIPGTNVRLLKWKSMNIYSAYPTRAMGPNIYAYNINRFGELTNFDFEVGEDETEAKIDYDKRDQTYAYLNLQQLINRNWRDKNKLGWWKENLPLITVIIATLLLILSMWFFFSQSGQQLAVWTQISENLGNAAVQCNPSNVNSGIVSAS